MTGLEQRARIVLGHVGRLVRPLANGEGKYARGEPSVEHVFVMVQRDGVWRRVGKSCANLGKGLVASHGRHPVVSCVGVGLAARRLAVYFDVVGRNAVAPPQLTRYAPVVAVLEPAEPDGLVKVGYDPEALLGDGTASARRHLLAVDVPL